MKKVMFRDVKPGEEFWILEDGQRYHRISPLDVRGDTMNIQWRGSDGVIYQGYKVGYQEVYVKSLTFADLPVGAVFTALMYSGEQTLVKIIPLTDLKYGDRLRTAVELSGNPGKFWIMREDSEVILVSEIKEKSK